MFSIYIYIYTQYIYAINSFPDFFYRQLKITVDSWKFSMLFLYILWDDLPIFMISGSNEQLQQQLEYTLLKPDAVKFCFKLWNNATVTYGMLQTAFGPSCMNRVLVFVVA